jgi:hypothetical protein
MPTPLATTLAALYAVSCHAMQNPTPSNLDAAFALLAPAYVEIDPNGRSHTRDEVIDLAKRESQSMHADQCAHAIDSIAPAGPDSLVAVIEAHFAGTMQVAGATRDFDVREKSADIWARVNGSWVQQQSRALHVVLKIDGNVVQDAGQ